jgi:putative ABC transport system ATP-binding protein
MSGEPQVQADAARGAERTEDLIALSGVTRSYDMGESRVVALDAVDLTIGSGEFVVVLGPSGSGKTTLLNVIGALDTVTSGRIVIGGHDITSADRGELARFRRHTVSFIFQSFNLFPGLTALENVEFGADVAGREGARGVARATLERVGLGARLGHFPHELSGGEQQRVAIARALANKPDILIGDEITGDLDSVTGFEVMEIVAQLNREQGMTVLYVTHDPRMARFAHRVIQLRDGLIAEEDAA